MHNTYIISKLKVRRRIGGTNLTSQYGNSLKFNVPKKKFRSNEKITGILFIMPVVLGIIIFVMYPMIFTLLLSFTDYNNLQIPKFVGLNNYINIFTNDPFFKKSLIVTAYYALGSVLVTMITAFLIAILLNQDIKGRAVFRTIFYLPTIVPAVASSILWLWLFNPNFGLLNSLLQMIGLPKQQWLSGETTVIPSLIVMSLWACGNTIIIFLAGLQDVPRQLIEAVDIDGGNWWHKFLYVTIPMVTPILFFNLIMNLINAFQTFTQAYVMTGGGPNNDSLFYVYLVYRDGFQENSMGYASALAWILFVIIAIITAVLFLTSKGWVYYEGGQNS